MPILTGVTPAGAPLSTRAYYLRRNLALLFVADDATGADWLREAAAVHEAARREAGEILVVAPPGMATGELPAIVDAERQLARRVGLKASDLPALFITDRYRTVFAGNRSECGLPELSPADIPSWLEFVACRCS